ncbi:MAG: class I SAM-dependent methyltransferase [Anaerolineales bacterium]|nr:class I SAM-dependent methyltransferase [Anaerolineales bacterium]MCB0027284.1 class I SAM-dependent methyltransferase [Anaerolineales bacterium]
MIRRESDDFEVVNCTICRSSSASEFTPGNYHLNVADPIKVVQCQNCGLYFLSPRPGAVARTALLKGELPESLRDYDSRTANYAGVTQSRTQRFTTRLDRLSQLQPARKGSSQALLDVGASAGTLVQLSRARAFAGFGVEPSRDGTLAALAESIQMPQAKAEALPYPADSFDIVHAHHVFEHLEDPFQAVKEAWRVLKPGGLIFIEVPNQFDNVMFKRDMLFRRVPQRQRNIRSIHHFWFFSMQTLARLLTTAGFAQVHVQAPYSWQARGWRRPFSLLTRLVGRYSGGGDLLQGYGWKPASGA